MTITFENDKDVIVIVYALDLIISYARNNQYMFVAQSGWWISSIIDLQQRLVIYLDIPKVQGNIGQAMAASDTHHIHCSRLERLRKSSNEVCVSEDESISITETDIHKDVIEKCEIFLEQCKQDREAIGRQTR